MLWIAVVNGAIEPERMAAEPGTVLTPLAEIAGPAVVVLGALFVVLAMGMASVHCAWGLRNATMELLRPVTATDVPTRLGMSSQTARNLASRAPIVAIMSAIALLFALDRESFTGPLGFLGVITAPLVAGIFSMMMLAAARRKGDCAVGYRWKFLGNRVVVASVCMTFLSAIVMHGLFIWTDPFQRAVALIVSAITLLFMIASVRTSFVHREVAEVRYPSDDHDPMPTISVIANGEVLQGTRTTLQMIDPSVDVDGAVLSLAGPKRNAVEIYIPPAPVRELLVWVHQIMPDGDSIPVSATLELNGAQSFHLDERAGRLLLPINGEAQRLIVRPGAGKSHTGVD